MWFMITALHRSRAKSRALVSKAGCPSEPLGTFKKVEYLGSTLNLMNWDFWVGS